jgi:hypothetical protein
MRSLLTEYGIQWTLNRTLYSGKIKMMSTLPITEKLFENSVDVNRIDLFDFDIYQLKDFLIKLPEQQKNEIILIADKAIDGVITGFSSIELNYGNPINWHYNPLTNAETKKDDKWYKIPDFDEDRGDIKVIWEASRFTHFFYFARAYLLTNDIKYYRAFSSQLEDWLEKNPYPFGANFKCGQECSLRMVNTLMVYGAFKECGLVTQKDSDSVSKLVEVCYKKVLSNFFYAHKCIKNNHTFSEILGLIAGGWCCNDEGSVQKAYLLLDQEIINQFQSDGGFTQYSFNYHRFTLQILECVYKIGEKTKIYITEEKRVINSVLLLYQVQNCDGDVPNYGSNDGALIFPLSSCGYRDFRPILNTVYALIEGKRLYSKGAYDEEILWFGNNIKLPIEYIEKKASNFIESGYFTLRHKGGVLMTCLQNYKSRPAHMDQLHIDLWHKGINIFCDTGTYSYASKLGKELTSTSGHNTLKVQEKEQMNKIGPFLITEWTQSKLLEHNPHKFEGEISSKNKYKHKREIKKNENGYIITDKISASDKYFEVYLHTPCEVKISENGFQLYYKSQLLCNVTTNEKIELKTAKRSLFYLIEEEINCLVIKGTLTNGVSEMTFNIDLVTN